MTTITAPTAAPTSFKVGDEVIPDPNSNWSPSAFGTVYVVEKVPSGARGVNYVVRPKNNPTGRGLKGPAYAFRAYNEGDDLWPMATFEIREPAPSLGSVIRAVSHPRIKAGTLMTVLGETDKGVKAALLGGDDNRYWRNLSMKNFEVVPLDKIIVA